MVLLMLHNGTVKVFGYFHLYYSYHISLSIKYPIGITLNVIIYVKHS